MQRTEEKLLETIEGKTKILDPEKSLDELYAGQENVLNTISQGRASIARAAAALESAVNTLHFQNLAMDKSIKDDTEMADFVSRSLTTCSGLIKK